MWGDLRKKSAYERLDGEEIVRVKDMNIVSVRENKVNHNSNKAQEDNEMDQTREGLCVGIGTTIIWQEIYDLNKKNKK